LAEEIDNDSREVGRGLDVRDGREATVGSRLSSTHTYDRNCEERQPPESCEQRHKRRQLLLVKRKV